MPRHIRFYLKSLVFETRSCIPGQLSDVKWSSWTWGTLCSLFVIDLYFKILRLIWLEKVGIQESYIFLLNLISSRYETICLQSSVYLSCQICIMSIRELLPQVVWALTNLLDQILEICLTGMKLKPTRS